MKQAFESKFPVPDGVYWDEELAQYEDRWGFDNANHYHIQWETWQAAWASAADELEQEADASYWTWTPDDCANWIRGELL